MLTEIGITQKVIEVREYAGADAVLEVTAEGRVVKQHPEGTIRQVTASVSHTLLVGTDVEVAAEKAVQDAKYAPIKAAADAAKAAAAK